MAVELELELVHVDAGSHVEGTAADARDEGLVADAPMAREHRVGEKTPGSDAPLALPDAVQHHAAALRSLHCGGEEGASVVGHAQSRWRTLQELEEVGRGPQVEVLRPGRRHAGPQTRRLVGAQVLPSRLA